MVRTVCIVLGRVGSAVWLFASWTVRSWRAILVCLVIGNVLVIAAHEAAGVAVQWLVPAWSLVRAVWHTASPLTYEVVLGGPLRRRAWRRRVRKEWARVAQRCGLAAPREKDERQTIAR